MAGAIWQKPSHNLLALPTTTITVSTGAAAAGYSVSDVASGNPAKGVKLAAATSFAIDIDLGASGAAAVKLLGVGNCNADAAIANFKLTGGASVGATTVSRTLTVPAAPADALGKYFYDLNEAQATAYRYWRVACSATNSLAWFIGQLWLSAVVQRFPKGGQIPIDTLEWTEIHAGVVHTTPTGVRLGYPDPARTNTYSGSVTGTLSEILAIRDWFREAQGIAGAASLFLPDTTNRTDCDWVYHCQDTLSMKPLDNDVWQAALRLKSLSPGLI